MFWVSIFSDPLGQSRVTTHRVIGDADNALCFALGILEPAEKRDEPLYAVIETLDRKSDVYDGTTIRTRRYLRQGAF